MLTFAIAFLIIITFVIFRPGKFIESGIAIVGLFSLFLLGSIAVAVAWVADAIPFQSSILWAAPAAVCVIIIGGLVVVWDGTYRLPPVQWLMHHMPGALQSLVQALRRFAHEPRAIVIAVVLSLISHSLIVLVFWPLFACAGGCPWRGRSTGRSI